MASFFDGWLQQQREYRDRLLSARGASYRGHQALIVNTVLDHYESLYRAKSVAAGDDPSWALSAPWASSLERALFWISGWRPTTLIHLLYSESGLRFEAQLDDLLLGVHSGDIGDLSPTQLNRIEELKRHTVQEEDEISRKMDELQAGAGEPFPPSDADLAGKCQRLKKVMGRADGLRLRTLHGVIGILEPIQAVDLLVVAADLEIGIREYGMERDRAMM